MWRFSAARATGTSHLKTNVPCQDRFVCETLGSDILIAAISDGAGSASRAEFGAEIAASRVVAELKRGLKDKRTDFANLLREAAVAARQEIAIHADRGRTSMREYASTLLAVVATDDGGGALQIGDGVIVVGNGSDEWSWMFWPQRGEYANTTHFLTDEDAIERLEIEVYSGTLSDVALMSDGLEPLALNYSSHSVHHPFFAGLLRPLFAMGGSGEIESLSASLEHFLRSERVTSRADDDLSLIIATRRTV